MNILQVITLSEVGGAQTVVAELSNALSRKGHRVTVVASPGGTLWHKLLPQVHQIPCPFFYRSIRPIDDIKATLFLNRLIRKENFDVIHLHSSKAGVWGRIASRKYRDRKIYTVHGFDTILKAHPQFLLLEKLLARQCKWVVPVSEYDQRQLLKNGITNVSIVKNGISRIFDMEVKEANIFKHYKKLGRKIILSLSRTQKPKRFDMFVDVARIMAPRDYEFFWLGNEEVMTGMPDNVHCMGMVENARAYLRFADLLVLFSDFEGLPVSILEAFEASVPVVASKVGGVTELLDGNNGLAIDNSIEAAVTAIETILHGNIEEHRKAAFATFQKGYTIEHMVDGYLRMYQECLE